MKKIYVADDDKNICDLFCSHLSQEGFSVETFLNGQVLWKKFAESPCDLIVTDVAMPLFNGYDLCRKVREVSDVPLIMISANHEEIDRILGLELGSDDYMAKPVSLRELSVKIKNIFRRMEGIQEANPKILTHQDLVLDVSAHLVTLCDRHLPVTPKEFELLSLLVSHKNKAFTREEIIQAVWQYDFEGDARQVDHVIKRLRKKMLEHGGECQIQTVWGVGYKVGF